MTGCNQILPLNLTDLHISFKKKRRKKGCAPQSKRLLKKHKVCAVSAPLWLAAPAGRQRSYWLVVQGRNVWLSSSSVKPDVLWFTV